MRDRRQLRADQRWASGDAVMRCRTIVDSGTGTVEVTFPKTGRTITATLDKLGELGRRLRTDAQGGRLTYMRDYTSRELVTLFKGQGKRPGPIASPQ